MKPIHTAGLLISLSLFVTAAWLRYGRHRGAPAHGLARGAVTVLRCGPGLVDDVVLCWN